MSQPRPMVSPPEASMRVKGPIHVPSPICGSPMIQACGLYGLAGMPCASACQAAPLVSPISGEALSHKIGHALGDLDGRLEADRLLGQLGRGSATVDEDFARVELWFDVDADRVDEDLGQLGDCL